MNAQTNPAQLAFKTFQADSQAEINLQAQKQALKYSRHNYGYNNVVSGYSYYPSYGSYYF